MSERANPSGFPVELEGVEKSFGTRRVLASLHLRVPRGRNLVVMGLSGTGKSVTLKILAGLLRPDAGSVRVAGVEVTTAGRREMAAVRSNLGFLFQGAALIKWLTAVENVALPLLEAGMPAAQAEQKAHARLAELGMADAAHQSPDELSGGQRKRVGFARATIHDPKIILYDEPTTGLDPITKRTVDELIVRGRDQYGATGVIVSHDLRSALRVADLIGLLYEGRMVAVGAPQEFLSSDHEIVRRFIDDDAPVGGAEART